MTVVESRPCVLVFAGLDPSGGAGLTADAHAIAGQGAHALTVCTALTVQDNDRVYGVQPVDAELVLRQARVLADKVAISAVKIGITGSAANARAIAEFIAWLRERQAMAHAPPGAAPAGLLPALAAPDLPVVLDPVLASGHGDLLSRDDAAQALAPLLPLTTVLTPNGPEAQALSDATRPDAQAHALRARGCRHVLITGGHGDGDEVVNRWYAPGPPTARATATAGHATAHDGPPARVSLTTAAAHGDQPARAGLAITAAPSASDGGCHREWRWPRIDGAFHGSGCTLASAIAAQLALGLPTAIALEHAQHYVYHALRDAYAIAPGQRIPLR
ncbi:hydroxymethylpyrimidine/phosphomethylpyrimidine kinase [Duganella sp. 1224]|uniref:bifunctional hydroxymethylpyrimidine kinase/phosphomethylpyrimidine kinase n=1 Tax=Duganella sp. 1224 TaxID=2587052 RepID=UPI00183661A4|nr:hydroxymethylpyrimidine/phosphomethylpyrimidine kinase [Duganella sp. 1224]NYE63906.1 hydroxymethylpyrimidine/phosphomethylpyrimidine kinase [Duganella sp. 1224]